MAEIADTGKAETVGDSVRLIALLLMAVSLLSSSACRSGAATEQQGRNEDPTILTVTSLVDGPNAEYEMHRLKGFAAKRKNLQVRYIPAFESVDTRLAMYKQLFKERSPQPDICEIDVIWPGMIADDLLELTPYFRDELAGFPKELLRTYTVRGRLIAIPLYLDGGLLYYRSDLLSKYGFAGPPETWDELEKMSLVIQNGERRAGNPNFWGYVWQGAATEALTCNALEWQTSQGGGNIIESDGRISVCNPNAIRATARAVNWIGSISPPGVTAYVEDDTLNVYAAGNAAFMRDWSSVYGAVKSLALFNKTGVALLPAGTNGRGRTMGGLAISVSRYSGHREEAVSAVRELVSAAAQSERAVQAGVAPTLISLQGRPDLMRQTAFQGPLMRGQAFNGLVARPSVVAGNSYDQVSKAYYLAVHACLTKHLSPAVAFGRLQTDLAHIIQKPN